MNRELKEELKGTFLEKVPKEEIKHNIPEGFFDQLHDDVLVRIKESEGSKIFSLITYGPILSMVASLAVIVACVFAFSKSDPNIFEDLSNQELLDYALELELEDADIMTLDPTDNAVSTLSIDEINKHLESDIEDLDIDEITEYL